ncbi:gluconate 2-dehydrogenase subunit 3 family protein [Fulvivirga sedimenti]|uniref:Gluconate 2-dehydrogenase subunit 3 family protein n=1 Tax=Fulvivirga sedimenti TaxID=2879465 RepID=A0A9X1HYD9_9BACT|nr:gluconate 2-dehydrogenase subunit 3 family protein [Fulvivirga sedimenti]MCA6078719.1 gluconate 2-dehydrogenase subunit 3 family protein [Fulvivirga sedimenti]
MKGMNRREALKRTALVMGTALSASTIAGIMQGCKAEPELTWVPVFFNEDQAQLVSAMAGTIIPKTGTPGAVEAGVPKFIEDMVKDVYGQEEQASFIESLSAFDSACKESTGNAFNELDSGEQESLLKEYNTRMQAAISDRSQEPSMDVQFFYRMKELTVTGFFTSQPGATEVLQYKAIPVEYHGCISLEEAGGKTWAT